jgi:predicted Zn finger-like uncharacterized protein
MSMITKCPACSTAFRVTPQHLQAQHGLVRCGRCATVFDGFKSLATQSDAMPHAPAAVTNSRVGAIDLPQSASAVVAVPGPAGAAPGSEASAATPVSATPPKPADLPAADISQDAFTKTTDLKAVTPATIPETGGVPPTENGAEPPPGSGVPDTVPPQTISSPLPLLPEAAHLSPAVVEAPPAGAIEETGVVAPYDIAPLPRRRSGFLAFGIIILLLALAAQGVYYYRGDIAANVPEARPYLDKICVHLRCSVALPQKPRMISIEASDLQAIDAANPGIIVLTATLRNQATTALGYPALDVVLTNAKDHTVARRIFKPAEYLAAGKDVHAGIAPSAEITIKLTIDSGDVGAAGFRLDLLAAPAP